jgi:subfamily B ATP-binding cassette protein MsbA
MTDKNTAISDERTSFHEKDLRAMPDCFDQSSAVFPTMVVPVTVVIDLLNQTHRPDRVEEFREAMDNGSLFPPVSVIRIGSRFILTDGHKRFAACKQRGMSHVMVELWTASRWITDLRSQTVRKTGQVIRLALRSPRDPDSRKAGVRLFWDIVGHWRRIFTSLLALLRGVDSTIGEKDRRQNPPTEPPDSIFWRLVKECTRFPGHLILITVSLAGLGAAQLYLTWLAKLWSEGPLANGDHRMMTTLLHRATLASAVLVISLFASRYFLRSINQLLVQSLRDRAQHRLLEVELASVRKFPIGDMISRMFNDAGMITNFVREILRRAIGESIIVIGSLAMAFYLNWRLALILSIVGPLVAIVLSLWGRLIRQQSERAQNELGTLSATLNEQLSGLSTIKGFETETHEHARFVAQDSRYRAHMLRAESWMALMMSSVWLATCVGLLGVVWYGTEEVFSHSVTRGALLAFCLYAVQTIEPLRRLSEVQGLLQRALAAAGRVFQVIDLPGVETSGRLRLSEPARGEVHFDRIDFRYNPDHEVLHNFNLKVGPRETLALVSTSGGGKSTIGNLMLRFIDPQAGKILLDGIPVCDLKLHELRRAICVVEQEPFIFTGTVADNISYGSFSASRQQIELAASQSALNEFLASLPHGLDTLLAEEGRNLSGGQKQRIALARAIVRNPAVLVLDEATSALDSETEQLIFDRIQPWLAERTVLIMSHRLATVSRFRRIVILQDGSIVGNGSVFELLANCAPFANLFAEQVAPLDQLQMESPV